MKFFLNVKLMMRIFEGKYIFILFNIIFDGRNFYLYPIERSIIILNDDGVKKIMPGKPLRGLML
jgi:hypothetical protein